MHPTMVLHKLESLPELIELVGIGLTGRVILDNKLLPRLASTQYNWGYDSIAAHRLSMAILRNYFSKKETLEFAEVFKDVLIANLPQGNFSAKVKFKELLTAILGPSEVAKPLSYFVNYVGFVQPTMKFLGYGGRRVILRNSEQNTLNDSEEVNPNTGRLVQKEDGSYVWE